MMKLTGVAENIDQAKIWAVKNLHGYYIVQDISTEGIQDLINKGYAPEHEDINDNITPNACLRIIDQNQYCEIITFHDEDHERVELKYGKQNPLPEQNNEEPTE